MPADGPFRIFANRKYALYFSGQLISQVGTWMQQVALSWFTYELTKSPFMLAVVGVSTQLPALFIMPFAGVIADRFNRHKIILWCQIFAMIEAAILAALTLTKTIEIPHLVLLGIFAGVINAFDMPTRSAFIMSLVEDKDDLPTAIAMNSSLMNLTRLIGPALAGFIVAGVGVGVCFLLNAVSYIAVIVSMLAIKGDFEPKNKIRRGIFAELKEGMLYIKNTSPIKALISLLGVFGMGAMAYAMLLPVFVKDIHGDATTLGYLMSASAVGSLVGTLILAHRRGVLGLGKWVAVSAILFSFGLIAFAFVHSFVLAMVVLAFMGATLMLMMASCSTILQSIIEEDKRGRVMSFFTMSFMGTAPIGSLLGGAIAGYFGLQITLLGCGLYCLFVAVTFALNMPRLRTEAKPIYIERGLLEAEEEVDLLTA